MSGKGEDIAEPVAGQVRENGLVVYLDVIVRGEAWGERVAWLTMARRDS